MLDGNLSNCPKTKVDWVFWIYKTETLPYWLNGFAAFTIKNVFCGVGLYELNMDPLILILSRAQSLCTPLGAHGKILMLQRISFIPTSLMVLETVLAHLFGMIIGLMAATFSLSFPTFIIYLLKRMLLLVKFDALIQKLGAYTSEET